MDFKKGITYKKRTRLRNFKAALTSDIGTALKNSRIAEDSLGSNNNLQSHHDRHVQLNLIWNFTGKQERASGDGEKRILFPLLASDTLLNEYKTLHNERENLKLAMVNLDNEQRIARITNELERLKPILIGKSINEYNRLANELMNAPAPFSLKDRLSDDSDAVWATNLHFGYRAKRLVNVKMRLSVVPGPRKARLYEYVIYETVRNNDLNRSKNSTTNEKKILSFGLADSFLLKVAFALF